MTETQLEYLNNVIFHFDLYKYNQLKQLTKLQL